MNYITSLVEEAQENISKYEAKLYFKISTALEEYMFNLKVPKSTLQAQSRFTQVFYMGAEYMHIMTKLRSEFMDAMAEEYQESTIQLQVQIYGVITYLRIDGFVLGVFTRINAEDKGYSGRKDINIKMVEQPSDYLGKKGKSLKLHPMYEALYHLELLWQPECCDTEKTYKDFQQSMSEWNSTNDKQLFKFGDRVKKFVGGGNVIQSSAKINRDEVLSSIPITLPRCTYERTVATCIGGYSDIEKINDSLSNYDMSVRKFKVVNPFDLRKRFIKFETRSRKTVIRMWTSADHQLIPVNSDKSAHILVDMTMALYEFIDLDLADGVGNGIKIQKLRNFANTLDKMLKLKSKNEYVEVDNVNYVGTYYPSDRYILETRLRLISENNHKRDGKKARTEIKDDDSEEVIVESD